jgi:hypothetical protein
MLPAYRNDCKIFHATNFIAARGYKQSDRDLSSNLRENSFVEISCETAQRSAAGAWQSAQNEVGGLSEGAERPASAQDQADRAVTSFPLDCLRPS